jgi:hypothetical protein
MPNTWIIDMTHYFDEHGAIVTAPGPARRLAEHFAAIVAAVTCDPCEAATGSIVLRTILKGHEVGNDGYSQEST